MTAGPSHHLETRSARLVRTITADVSDKEWRARAACRYQWPDLFFGDDDPISGAVADDAAKAVCRHCPVRADCLAWALASGEAGVWGGTTEDERAALRAKQNR